MSTTAFDDIIGAFQARLQLATAVCPNIEVDDDAEPLPAARTESVLITLAGAEPEPLGGIEGNPIDWITRVNVHCFASNTGSSARPAVNTLARKVYERLAADKALGLAADKGVYIGEPKFSWETDKADRRYARCTLAYQVRHRTVNLSLD